MTAAEYIAEARACGLTIIPWRSLNGVPGVAIYDVEGDKFGPANERLAEATAGREPPKDSVFLALCADFGIEPDDPDLCQKVYARVATAPERRA